MVVHPYAQNLLTLFGDLKVTSPYKLTYLNTWSPIDVACLGRINQFDFCWRRLLPGSSVLPGFPLEGRGQEGMKSTSQISGAGENIETISFINSWGAPFIPSTYALVVPSKHVSSS